MVLTEREAEPSLFASLQHIQAVCILIFECFGLLMPIGIVALIAPQIALIGADIFSLLAMFCYAFFGVSIFVLVGTIFVLSLALRIPPHIVFSSLLKPMMLGASTRNTLVCIPLALETLTKDFRVARAPCELFIPVGFATLRFGTILYFIIATLFMGTLLGRNFSVLDLLLVAVRISALHVSHIAKSGESKTRVKSSSTESSIVNAVKRVSSMRLRLCATTTLWGGADANTS